MKKIGIIGRGFVGSAVEFGFSSQTGCNAEIKVYDKNIKLSQDGLSDTVNSSDFIFLSVPTPQLRRSINLETIESALEEISNVNKRSDNIILIRSTIVPGWPELFNKSLKI